MKYETMLKILFLLLSKGKVSAKYIAQRFEISTRTVMRYLDTMSLANIPIIADTGRNGGFYIADSYKLPANFLTEREFNAVVSTLTSYNQNMNNQSINSAIDKLLSIKSVDKRTVDVKSGNLIIDGSSWNGNDNTKNVISLISSAIEDCKKALIGYVDRNGEETIRIIEPHVIILKQGLWYVYGFCHLRNAFRMFKASRITFADLKAETFEKRKVEINSLTNGRWFENLPSEQITLGVLKSAKPEVEEWLGVNSVFTYNGELVAQANLPYDEWLVSKILSFGGRVTVIAPEKLKQDVLNMAKNIVSMYK
ncbi:MAG: YafY family transcriptional regulator [Clostridia bacterium]|nr:YafY family transcriptional regulator [Clostridia bacterium]